MAGISSAALNYPPDDVAECKTQRPESIQPSKVNPLSIADREILACLRRATKALTVEIERDRLRRYE